MKREKGKIRIKNLTFYDDDTFLTKVDKKTRDAIIDSRSDEKYGPLFDASRIIYSLRKKLKLTQDEIAKMCGTTKQYISRLENNYYKGIGINTIARILDRLGYRMMISVLKK